MTADRGPKRGKPDLGRGSVPPPPKIEKSKKAYDRKRDKKDVVERVRRSEDEGS